MELNLRRQRFRTWILVFSLTFLLATGLRTAISVKGEASPIPPGQEPSPRQELLSNRELPPGQELLLPEQELLQPQQMREDLDYVTSVIQQVHPAMASHSAREEFAARASSVKMQLNHPLPAWRFFALANALVSSLQDAHTSLSPPDAGILPVTLTWAADGIVVSRVLDPTLPMRPGDELVSLGDRTPEQLLTDLSAWIPHGNPYWVKALSSQYLGNALTLQGLGLVSTQDTGEGTVSMAVRRPVTRLPDGTTSHGVRESQAPQESPQSSSDAVITAEVPIWSGLTITGMVDNTDTATGRTFSPAAEAGLKPGDRILKVDGVPAISTDDLARAVQEFGRQDRALTLEVLRKDQRLTFTVRPIPRRDPGSSETTYVIGVAFGRTPTPAVESRPWFGWTIDNSAGYGLFWLDECNNTKDYRQAVDEFFDAVRRDGIQRIAIDLRRNGGGNSMVVSAFLKYLPYSNLRAVSRWTRFSTQLARQRSFWLRVLTWLSQTFFNGRWFPYPIQPRVKANQLFRGRVYVLTSWHSFSSAVDFAALLSDNHMAHVAGAPTGGTPSGYGDILNFKMPNTGWYFNVSTTRFVRPDPARDPADSLHPDVSIPATMRDVREGRDPVLEWLRRGD